VIINTASIAGRQGYGICAPLRESKALPVISLTRWPRANSPNIKSPSTTPLPGVVVTPLGIGLEQDMIDKGVIKQKGRSSSKALVQHTGLPSKPSCDSCRHWWRFWPASDSDFHITGRSSWLTAVLVQRPREAVVAIGASRAPPKILPESQGVVNSSHCLQRGLLEPPQPPSGPYSF